MAARSFTSSSEARSAKPLPNQDDAPLTAVRAAAGRRRTFPRAFVMSIALVLAFEVALRASGWPAKWPYEIGRMEYFVAAAQLERYGAADIAVVGSSRTRESLYLPLLAEKLKGYAGKPLSVASYAVSGAYASDFEAIGKRLLRATPRPRMLLIGTSERDLIATGASWDEVATFHNIDDLPEVYRERGMAAVDELPVVIRSSIGRHWRTLGLREMLRFKMTALATGRTDVEVASPAEGGLTSWQRSSPTRNLRRNPIPKSRIVERSANFRVSEFPDPQLADSLDDLLTACDEASIDVVLYEVQQSRVLRNALPPGLYDRYINFIAELAAKHDDTWVRLDQLGLKIDDRDMRETSHMSVRGAKRLTEALATKVVGPMVTPIPRARARRIAGLEPTTQETTQPATEPVDEPEVPSPGNPGEG